MSTQAVLQEIEATSPQVAYMQLATGYWVSQALYVAAKLRIAELLKDSPRTTDELAAECGAHAPSLYRVLRMLASCGVFAEDSEGRFAMTPLAEMLQSGPGSMRAMTLHLGEGPSWAAWGALLDSVQTGETAFVHANGKEVFPYYAEHPESNEPFNQAMTDYSGAVISAIMPEYDFSGFAKIVDVGGGHGSLLSAILKANPQARGVLFDLPPAIEGARTALEAAGLQDRCELVGGDFFESVPQGGDAYVLKHIIHDWDEERALAILRNVRAAMADGGRLLLVETVIPEGNNPSFSKFSDVHMMVMTGGQERTEAEYAALFRKAGFALTRIVRTESLVSVVEAVKA
jgi:hypothetical protein